MVFQVEELRTVAIFGPNVKALSIRDDRHVIIIFHYPPVIHIESWAHGRGKS